MEADFILVIGVILAVFCLPSFLNAITESVFPRVAIAMGALAAACISFANSMNPSGYAMGDVPAVFVRVFAQLVN